VPQPLQRGLGVASSDQNPHIHFRWGSRAGVNDVAPQIGQRTVPSGSTIGPGSGSSDHPISAPGGNATA
jgi:hypothetical protein